MAIIPFGEQFPYTNTHDLNLDWIIRMIKELNEKFDEAISAKMKFADPLQWDITKQYETLTIVLNDETAYLSMQPVPAGTAITNTEYWQPVFDMSEFYNQMEDMEEELSQDIEDLGQETTEAIAQLDSITVKNNSTKHVLFLGDSYSTWFNSQLFTTFSNRCGVPADQIHNLAVSGASFNDVNNSFLMQVSGYTGDKTKITDIIVAGGINDALLAFDNYDRSYPDTSAVTSAIDAFKTYCDINYPNAKLHIAYIGGCLPTSTYYSSLHPDKSQQWALWCYTVYAGGKGFNVLKTWNTIHTSPYNYDSDGLHPSQNTGCVALGESIAAAFNENSIIYNRPVIIVTVAPSGKTQTSQLAAFAKIINDMCIINIPDNYIQITSGQTLNATDWSEILTLNNQWLFMVRGQLFYNVNISINGFTGITTPTIVPGEIMINDGKIYLKVFYPSGGTWQTITAGSFATITFPGFNNIELPLWNVN